MLGSESDEERSVENPLERTESRAQVCGREGEGEGGRRGRERGEGVGCVSRVYNPPSPSVLGVDGGWQGRREAKLCEECAISEQSTRWRRAGFGGRGWGPGKGASTGVLVWCAMTVNPPLSVSLSPSLSAGAGYIRVCSGVGKRLRR